MNDVESQRARAEAVERVPRALASARRAQLWAGLNRYLGTEAEHARKVAKQEREAQKHERRSAEPAGEADAEPGE